MRTIPDCLERLELQFPISRVGQVLRVRFSDRLGNRYQRTKEVDSEGKIRVYLVPVLATETEPAIEYDLPLRLLNGWASPFGLEVRDEEGIIPYRVEGVQHDRVYLETERYSDLPTDKFVLDYESA